MSLLKNHPLLGSLELKPELSVQRNRRVVITLNTDVNFDVNFLVPELAKVVTQHQRHGFSGVTFTLRRGRNIERIAEGAVSRVAGVRDDRPDAFPRAAFDQPLKCVVLKPLL